MKKIHCSTKKKGKKIIRFFLFVLLPIIFGFIFLISSFLSADREIKVNFFDVGQGDSSLIKTDNGKYILIDGGPDNRILKHLGRELPFWKRKIDIILISHFHDDHILGLIEIIKRYKIGIIILQKESPTSTAYQIFLESIAAQKIKYLLLDNIYNVSFGNICNLYLIPPSTLGVKKDDNNSLISRLSCGDNTFLFSGDNNLKVEKGLLASKINLKSDIFKASHHGSITANGSDFLKLVSPQAMVISVGLNNKFKHPSPLVLERARSLGIKIYRSDLDGNIEIIKKY